ncbi:folate-binding protein YgfZ [Corynebacterium kroppenstedtii]|uniref:CAF17-like 4Fe-4S cluster assembly/insertion protein YgfZ n=1 Tax=Corynebacterium kroppenstedtii TaxID=161879 RepID=UPI00145E3D94|nr:folate-binding protein YgfZ [Corynebacterium kroppenstedtii]QRP11325.1 folate-binding protein YgfZ [Corynebacterium kroppenstedtii]HJD69021.1 folate-binding protein [Corynebacterium kroppenstedtii]
MATRETSNTSKTPGEAPTPTTYQSPLLDAIDGAADAPDGHQQHGVAWHYGNPLGEQRAFERFAGAVDRSHQRVLQISGADTLSWLNSLISQKIDALSPGSTTHGLILDAKGHIEHAFTIVRPQASLPDRDEDPSIYLISGPDTFDALQTYLTQMVFWSAVSVHEADLALITVIGPDTSTVVAHTLEDHHATSTLAATTPPDTLPEETITFTDPLVGTENSVHLLVPRPVLTDAFTTLIKAGAKPTGLMAYEAERIKAVIPEVHADLDDRTVPHEIDSFIGTPANAPTQRATADDGPTVSYVHLNKGCYRGQETVSRIQNLGRPPRLLVKLQVDGYSARRPEPGEAITSGKRKVGRIGTVVDDCDEGPIALGLVKRSIVEKLIGSGATGGSRSAVGTQTNTLEVEGTTLAIDPDSTHLDEAPKAGRQAVDKLRGKTR